MDTKRGLYKKYSIQKTDGKPIDTKAKYVVLRYDEDTAYCQAVRTALLLFARIAAPLLPQFSRDLKNEIGMTEVNIVAERRRTGNES